MKRFCRFQLSILTFLLLASCSLFYQNEDNTSKVRTLALVNGENLSSPSANDITPFLFRQNGRAWLFFSSDRDGNYSIYYAEMFTNGMFDNPQLVVNLNSASDELSPVLYTVNNTNFITFLRVSNTITNLEVYAASGLNFSFQNSAYQGMNVNFNRIGLLREDPQNLELFLMNGTSNVNYTYADGSGGWSSSIYSYSINNPVLSMDSFMETNTGIVYIGVSLSGQLGGGVGQYNAIAIPAYASDGIDRDIFVDNADGYKVYFSSLRNGTGNYDLYRYNLTTFKDALLGSDKAAPFITSISPLAGTTNSGNYLNLIVNVTDSGFGIESVQFNVNGGSWQDMGQDGSWYGNIDYTNMNILPLSNIIRFSAEDYSGNKTITNIVIYQMAS